MHWCVGVYYKCAGVGGCLGYMGLWVGVGVGMHYKCVCRCGCGCVHELVDVPE